MSDVIADGYYAGRRRAAPKQVSWPARQMRREAPRAAPLASDGLVLRKYNISGHSRPGDVGLAFIPVVASVGIAFGIAHYVQTNHSAASPAAAVAQSLTPLAAAPFDAAPKSIVRVAPAAPAAQPQAALAPQPAQTANTAPISHEEAEAAPFIDRMLGDAALIQDIKDITDTNATDSVELMTSIAFESGGKRENFYPYPGHSAATPVQIMPDQFIALIKTYGKTYPDKMRAHAQKVINPARAAELSAHADELQAIAPLVERFVHVNPKTRQVSVDNKSYGKYMAKHYPGAVFAPLDQRVNTLLNFYPVSVGMQDFSTKTDSVAVLNKLVNSTPLYTIINGKKVRIKDPAARQEIITQKIDIHTLPHDANFFGAGKFFRFVSMLMTGRGDRPVVGNVLTPEQALKNAAAHMEKTQVWHHGHRVTKWKLVSNTVAEEYHNKIEKADLYKGMFAHLQREGVRMTPIDSPYSRPSAYVGAPAAPAPAPKT